MLETTLKLRYIVVIQPAGFAPPDKPLVRAAFL